MWDRLLKSITELLIPTRCHVCQHPAPSQICENCCGQFEVVGEKHCIRCGRRRHTEFASPDCSQCFGESIGVVKSRSAYLYNEPARKALAEFKFNSRPGVGSELCRLAVETVPQKLGEFYAEPDFLPGVVTAVPLHPNRMRKRRFNQSELIARKLSAEFEVEYLPDLLRRDRDTKTQVGLTSPQRWQNVRGAFSVDKGDRQRVVSRNVLLVDDLMTTGATLAACAQALKRAGSGLVYGFTLFSTFSSGSD